MQKAQRLLRSALWRSSSPLNRVTAVVVDDLAESFVAAVTRMVLVGRGGVRLHEEVFLAGVRLHGRRAMAEEKAEAALDQALDGAHLALADEAVRAELCEMWNEPDATAARPAGGIDAHACDAPPRAGHRAARPPPGSRHPARPRDLRRVPHATCTSRSTSSNAPRRRPPGSCSPTTSNASAAATSTRCAAASTNSTTRRPARSTAIAERYADVKPHTTAAAVVFALTPDDADRVDGLMARPRRRTMLSAAELHRQWLELVDTDGPFLAVAPLKRVWPNGIPDFRSDHADRFDALVDARKAFEPAWEDLDRAPGEAALDAYRISPRQMGRDGAARRRRVGGVAAVGPGPRRRGQLAQPAGHGHRAGRPCRSRRRRRARVRGRSRRVAARRPERPVGGNAGRPAGGAAAQQRRGDRRRHRRPLVGARVGPARARWRRPASSTR